MAAGHPIFTNAIPANKITGRRGHVPKPDGQRPVTVRVVHTDGTVAHLRGTATAWSADRVLVQVVSGLVQYIAVFAPADVTARDD